LYIKVLLVNLNHQPKTILFMALYSNRLGMMLLAVAVLLLIPFVAMQFTAEVNWTVFDFVVAGTLLFGTALLCELVLRSVTSTKSRLMLCAVILLVLVLVWLELAVGIFGTPLAGS
jgi:hypothetical protein